MSGHEKQSGANDALSQQVQMLQKAIDELKNKAGMAPQTSRQAQSSPSLVPQALRMDTLTQLVKELQKDNATLRSELKTREHQEVLSSRTTSAGVTPIGPSHGPVTLGGPGSSHSSREIRENGIAAPNSFRSNSSSHSTGSFSRSAELKLKASAQKFMPKLPRCSSPPRLGDVHISPSGSPQVTMDGKNLAQLPTVEVVKEAGGSDADLSFLKYHQDILDTFRPALRALASGLINYKFEHHDHIILPYYRTYMYGGEAYVLYHEADKAEKNRNPLERVPFRRPLDMDIFVPIDVKDWSEPHRLQRKQELFIQDLWKIWGRQEVQVLAEMAMRSLNNRGFDLTGPYMSTAVSALFLKDPGMRGNMAGPGGRLQFHPSQIDNDRMYRKVCLEYYDATADHMVTLCEFQLKPRISWGDFDEVFTMMLNNQDLTVQSMVRGPAVIKNKRAQLPPCIRVPSVKKVIRVACTGVSGNRAVQIREVDGVVQLHAPQDRCRNPNPQGIPTVPIKAVTDLSRRDWFLDTIVTPLMKTDPDVLQDVRQLSRQMQKEQNVFPEMGTMELPKPEPRRGFPSLHGKGSGGSFGSSAYSNNSAE